MKEIITKFSGEYHFLSNFYPCKIIVGINKKRIFPSVEHLYQASKTKDKDRQEGIRIAPNASIAKQSGRLVPLREDWEEIKEQVMENAVLAKFLQNEDLQKKLIDTKPFFLVEGNHWHDNFWGDCYCRICKEIYGRNKLGKILMDIRNRL